MVADLFARSSEIVLEARVGEHVSEDDGGCAAAGLDIARVVDSADDAVVSVVVGAGENFFVFLGNDFYECIGIEVSVERVAAGVGAFGFSFADRVQGGVGDERAGAGVEVLERWNR